MDALRALGPEPWFNLGDLDLATHLFRTGRLREGRPLSEVTRDLAAAMGVGPTLLPMSDDEVETHVLTRGGSLVHYQDFFVRRAAADDVRQVLYRGAEAARPAPGVLDAIAGADLVVLAPSNPLASIGPILAVPGIRDALVALPRSGRRDQPDRLRCRDRRPGGGAPGRQPGGAAALGRALAHGVGGRGAAARASQTCSSWTRWTRSNARRSPPVTCSSCSQTRWSAGTGMPARTTVLPKSWTWCSACVAVLPPTLE